MKVLIANWVYNWGSTGYIVRDLRNELEQQGHVVKIAAGRTYGSDNVRVFCTPAEQRLFWRLHRLGFSPFRGSTIAAKRLINYIKIEKPDIVNLHLLHCNFLNLYFLLRWLGKNNVKTVITNHAELYFTGSCGYAYDCLNWQTTQCRNCPNKYYATGGAYIFGDTHRNWVKMSKAFSYFKKENLAFTAVSPWTRDRFYQSPITKGFDCSVTLNGLDITTFYRRDNIPEIRRRLGGESYIIWVTAQFDTVNRDDVKGGYYLVELAQLMPQKKFVVVTTNVSNANNLPPNIFLWGRAKDQDELAQLYSGASLSVLVSRRETFSMVTAESLCCGTPVVGFKAGGPESIAIPEYSLFVEQADTNSLVSAIEQFLATDINRQEISNRAREKYSPHAMALQYVDAYNNLLKR